MTKDKISASFGIETETNIEDRKRSNQSVDDKSLYSFKINSPYIRQNKKKAKRRQ